MQGMDGLRERKRQDERAFGRIGWWRYAWVSGRGVLQPRLKPTLFRVEGLRPLGVRSQDRTAHRRQIRKPLPRGVGLDMACPSDLDGAEDAEIHGFGVQAPNLAA